MIIIYPSQSRTLDLLKPFDHFPKANIKKHKTANVKHTDMSNLSNFIKILFLFLIE